MMSNNRDGSSDFISRLVYWIGLFCLGYVFIAFRNALGFMFSGPGAFSARSLSEIVGIISVAVQLIAAGLLLIGALRLLKRQRGGAIIVIISALSQVGAGLLSSAIYMSEHAANSIRSSSIHAMPVLPSEMVFPTLFNWCEHSAFLLLVCAILLQKEMRQHSTTIGVGGFEVIPLATAAPLGGSGSEAVQSGAAGVAKDGGGP